MPTSTSLLSRMDEGVLNLTLNRPDKLNAFNVELHLALREQFDRAREDAAIRAVLLTGAGRAFSAGQDLSDRDPRQATGPRDLGQSLNDYYNPLLRMIRDLRKPVIAAVNGVAAGAGANIALACDIVIAARSARFVQAFSKVGLVPDSGGTWSLPRILGEPRAKALALTGEPLSAELAASWGLIWKVVDDADLADQASQLARSLARGPTLSLGLTKHLMQLAASNTLDQQLDLERDAQRIAGHSSDYAEGVTAFLEKRKPEFRGE